MYLFWEWSFVFIEYCYYYCYIIRYLGVWIFWTIAIQCRCISLRACFSMMLVTCFILSYVYLLLLKERWEANNISKHWASTIISYLLRFRVKQHFTKVGSLSVCSSVHLPVCLSITPDCGKVGTVNTHTYSKFHRSTWNYGGGFHTCKRKGTFMFFPRRSFSNLVEG